MILTIVLSIVTFCVGFVIGTLVGYTLLSQDFMEDTSSLT